MKGEGRTPAGVVEAEHGWEVGLRERIKFGCGTGKVDRVRVEM